LVLESWPVISTATPAIPIQALQRTDLTGPVLELPLGESWLDAPAQFRGIAHGRPVVNGYSGYAPPPYRLTSIALRLDDADVLDGLTARTPLVVALNRREELDRWRGVLQRRHAERVADDDQFEIYRLQADTKSPVHNDDVVLPIGGIEV